MLEQLHGAGFGTAQPLSGHTCPMHTVKTELECIDDGLLFETVRLRHTGQGHPLVVGVGIAP